jgi:hypothetical protein
VVLPQHDTLCPALPPALMERLQAAGALASPRCCGGQGTPGAAQTHSLASSSPEPPSTAPCPLVLHLPRPFALAMTGAPPASLPTPQALAFRYLQAQCESAARTAKGAESVVTEAAALQAWIGTPAPGAPLHSTVQVTGLQAGRAAHINKAVWLHQDRGSSCQTMEMVPVQRFQQ